MNQSWKRISFISFIVLGALALSVFIVACGGGNSASIIVQNPTPSITSLSPSSAPTGSNSASLTINGTGFLATSTVTFNGAAHSATYVNSSQLTISLTAQDLATAGNYPVVVTNPAPGGGTSTAVSFSVVTNNPVPTITTLSPSYLIVGATPQMLTINGSGFFPSSTITYNAVAHGGTYLSASQLTISLTTTDLGTAGSYPVVVTNPAPGGGSSNGFVFSVLTPNSLVTYTDPLFTVMVPANWTALSQTLTSGGPNDPVRMVSFSVPTDQIPVLYVFVYPHGANVIDQSDDPPGFLGTSGNFDLYYQIRSAPVDQSTVTPLGLTPAQLQTQLLNAVMSLKLN